MKRVASIGECMIELSEIGPGRLQRSFGGDTLNSAVYMARELAGTDACVSYVTALGDDPFSEEMIAQWQEEGLDTGLVARHAGRLPGLYLIRTDERGERSFFYWREQAAVRSLLSGKGADELLATLAGFDLVYLSGITLAIFGAADRERLIGLLAEVRRRGGRTAFDPNYRPRLWPDAEEARRVMTAAAGAAAIVLPTFDDEAQLFGDADAHATIERLAAVGCEEIVVKAGPAPTTFRAGGETRTLAPEVIENPVDTTGAGDSFNGAYLAARLRGATPGDAVAAGHALAAKVVMEHGGVTRRR